MAKMTGRWIKLGAIGCGGVVLLFLVTFLATTLLTVESGSWYDHR